MFEGVEQQIGDVKELLKVPTPENFAAATEKLSSVSIALQAVVSAPPGLRIRNDRDTAFLFRLPSEMEHIRRLFQAPVRFLEGLALFRAQKFGSYNHQGQMKGLGQESAARTITHL